MADRPPAGGIRVEKKDTRTATTSMMDIKLNDWIKKNLQTILIVLSVLIGTVLGCILRTSKLERWSDRDVMYVGFIGELYIRALKCLIIPLVLSSIISAIGHIDLSMSRNIALRAILYYLATTILAVILGLILVTSIQPGGNAVVDDTKANSNKPVYPVDMIMDIARNILPPNLIQAMFETYKTEITPPDKTLLKTQHLLEKYNITEVELLPLHEWDIEGIFHPATNIMGVLICSIALAVALSILEEKGKPLLNCFHSLSRASMVITGWLVWISPLGISLLIASLIIDVENLNVMLNQVGMYFVTCIAGFVIHSLLILPCLYFIFVHKPPHRFIFNMGKALMTAFATATSSGTLPITLDCLENNNHIDKRISRFVLPIGATVNMDGTALYEAVAALFIAQRNGMVMSFGQVIAISITATMASIGASGTPSAGAVTTLMVLNSVGLPDKDIGLIIGIDWLVDRFRTAMNVLGDSIGAAIVYEFSKDELDKLDREHPEKVSKVKLLAMKNALINPK